MYRRDFVCIFSDNKKRVINSCICGTPEEIRSVIKKLILSSDKSKPIFWKKVVA